MKVISLVDVTLKYKYHISRHDIIQAMFIWIDTKLTKCAYCTDTISSTPIVSKESVPTCRAEEATLVNQQRAAIKAARGTETREKTRRRAAFSNRSTILHYSCM